MKATRTITIRFVPDDISVEAAEGETILRAAHAAGIHIASSCGGQGVCGKCLIAIKEGVCLGGESEGIGKAERERGLRLACTCRADSDVVVEVPASSRLDRGLLDRRPPRVTGRLAADREKRPFRLDPPVKKFLISLDPPSATDHTADLTRVLRALTKQHNIEGIPDMRFASLCPAAIRGASWSATVTTAEHESGRLHLVNIEAGDTTDRLTALAIDLGTTTVCGELIDCTRGETLAEASEYNDQIRHGDDVISRIIASQKGDGRRLLQEAAAASINRVITRLLEQSGAKRSDIAFLSLAGNTTMTHLLMGLDAKHIRLAPYTPVVNEVPIARAADLGIDLGGHVTAAAMPLVASWIGGDIVAGVLAAGVHRREGRVLFIDLGTNGEIVLGGRELLIAASCSAGPAFEGGGIRHGMRAADGAIEEIRIDPGSGEPVVFTIGGAPPRGICGSGVINITAELLETGLLEPNGKFKPDAAGSRLRQGPDGFEYLLVPAAASGTGSDIVFTEVDIDNFMRAKAAMYAGCRALLEMIGMDHRDLDEIIIAGSFGSYIDIEKSIITGLLPDIPLDRFTFAGNSSLAGARAAAISREALRESVRIARAITNVELSEHPNYMDHYTAALFFPHTEARLFPSVQSWLGGAR